MKLIAQKKQYVVSLNRGQSTAFGDPVCQIDGETLDCGQNFQDLHEMFDWGRRNEGSDLLAYEICARIWGCEIAALIYEYFNTEYILTATCDSIVLSIMVANVEKSNYFKKALAKINQQ